MKILIRPRPNANSISKRRFKSTLLPYWVYWPQRFTVFIYNVGKEFLSHEGKYLLIIILVFAIILNRPEEVKEVLGELFANPVSLVISLTLALIGALLAKGSKSTVTKSRLKQVTKSKSKTRTEIR